MYNIKPWKKNLYACSFSPWYLGGDFCHWLPVYYSKRSFFKGGPWDLGTKILQKNTKKSSLYPRPQSLLIFIHRTPVVERHPITREIRDLLWPMSTPTGNTVYFYMSSSFIYTLKIHKRSFKHSVRWWYYGKKLHVCYVVEFNPFPHNNIFWRPWETSLLKTLWEREKLLITSNFSFSHSVFYPFG